jgi:hypothetical protein
MEAAQAGRTKLGFSRPCPGTRHDTKERGSGQKDDKPGGS